MQELDFSLQNNVTPGEEINFQKITIQRFLQAKEITRSSQLVYERSITEFLDWGKKNFNSYTSRDFDIYKNHLIAKKLKNSTVCNKLSALKSFFKWLSAKDLIAKNPTLILELPVIQERLEDLNIQEDVLAEIRASVITNPRDKALLEILLHGLRRSEIAKLLVEDFHEGKLYVRKAKANSDRVVPLYQEAVDSIRYYLGFRGDPNPQEPLILSEAKGKEDQPLSDNGIYYIVKKWADVNPHQFRHTLGYLMEKRGIAPHHGMNILGHKSISAYNIYSKQITKEKAREKFLGLDLYS